ncbi:protein serine/threonine phosphatase 2C [Basidiobolus meristosporus CBS 931.73]|uniref:Protein serine/threonine phosphatase 2C n=1 Tax=Basidiobolus meristosporus CBS 931.73 TaxID=1314790 RepID=A0A1Y1Y0I5_9FUNG|nr:protein serine/threonine phosphatase 2C [Basidiobolus meristosporus CBS 931.73]|eukprot:ORX91523.1 protein serine/threonine phosphatase 2C [Basidiobolus meristosporus CBS 931.73]
MTRTFSLVSAQSTDIGNVAVQQDDALIVNSVFGPELCDLYAVFDGHGSYGNLCSRFVKNTLAQLITTHKQALNQNIEKAITQLFHIANELLDEESAIDNYISGSTAVLVLVLNNQLVVANLGDSRAVLARDTEQGLKAVPLTEDHTCENPAELERVKSCGARVEQLQIGNEFCGPLRIFKGSLPYPGLAMTRAFGDSSARKLGVLCQPDIKIYDVQPEDKFLILATDGVWQGVTNQEAVELVNQYGPSQAQEATTHLTNFSLEAQRKADFDDNTTNICVFFKRS